MSSYKKPSLLSNLDNIRADRILEINGFVLAGGGACPEQYDVFHNGKEVGYLRLRHGDFTAEFCGKIVYTANPNGDGIFDETERTHFLTEAVKAISVRIKKEDIQHEL